MLEKFQKNIDKLLEKGKSEKILLAISGGIDSMVMLDLFHKLQYNIFIAHCNFNLRGNESDDDEEFVRNIALRENITFHHAQFETEEYARENGISIQMAARDLRFEWFFKLMKEHGYEKIALAHNLNDKTETFFINLIRGSGLKGLKGMKEKNDVIIRPLLNYSRQDIEKHAQKNHISYREDSSNRSSKYLRNKIRHHITPIFMECSPSFLSTMNENMKRLDDAWKIYDIHIKSRIEEITEKNKDNLKINITKLKEDPQKEILSFEIFQEYNFAQTTITNILDSLDHQPGLLFYSNTHRCVKDREFLIITKNEKITSKKFYIEKDTLEINNPIKLVFEIFENSKDYNIKKEASVAQLDLDKLIFPLILRKWQKGDFFQPIGMIGNKKLSDYFSDRKFSIFDKEHVWILTSGEKIVWIVGHRIDHKFRITGETKSILNITYVKS